MQIFPSISDSDWRASRRRWINWWTLESLGSSTLIVPIALCSPETTPPACLVDIKISVSPLKRTRWHSSIGVSPSTLCLENMLCFEKATTNLMFLASRLALFLADRFWPSSPKTSRIPGGTKQEWSELYQVEKDSTIVLELLYDIVQKRYVNLLANSMSRGYRHFG